MFLRQSKTSIDIERITSTVISKNADNLYLRKRKKRILFWKRMAMPKLDRERAYNLSNYWKKVSDFYVYGMLLGNTMDRLALSVVLSQQMSAGAFNSLLVFNTLIFVMPITYVEIFLGRYTRLTNAALYKMAPIFFGYCVLIFGINTIYLPVRVFDISKLTVQMLRMLLMPDHIDRCVDNSTTCYDFKVHGPINNYHCVHYQIGMMCGDKIYRYVSSYNYWMSLEMEKLFSFRTMCSVCLICVSLYVLCRMSMRVIGVILKVAFFYNFVIYTIILLMALFKEKSTKAYFVNFLEFDIDKIGLQELIVTVLYMTSRIGLITPSGFMTYAAYDNRGNFSAAVDSFAIGLLNMLLGMYYVFIFHTVGFSLSQMMQVNIGSLLVRFIEVYATLIPEYLTINGCPEVFVMAFLLSVILLEIVKMGILIRMHLMNFYDLIPQALVYEKQIGIGLSFLLFFCSMIIIPLEHLLKFSKRLFFCNMYFLHGVKLLGEVFLIFYCYGVSRLDDDFSFATSRRPIRFWRTIWYFYPTMVFLGLLHSVIFMLKEKHFKLELLKVPRPKDINYALSCIVGLYAIIFFSCTFFYSVIMLKKENSIDLLSPHFNWGPPDRTQRAKRKLYAPRKLIRSEPLLLKKIRWRVGAIKMLHDMDSYKRKKRGYIFTDTIFFENIHEIKVQISDRELAVTHLN